MNIIRCIGEQGNRPLGFKALRYERSGGTERRYISGYRSAEFRIYVERFDIMSAQQYRYNNICLWKPVLTSMF